MRIRMLPLLLLASCSFGLMPCVAAAARPDVLIADFEGDSYGDWKVEGKAFGTRPAVANVSPPNKVAGHNGKGLVNHGQVPVRADQERRVATCCARSQLVGAA